MAAAGKRTRGGSGGRLSAASAERRVAILLEQIQEQNRATIEAVFSTKQELRREIDEVRAELSRRIDVLQMAVQGLVIDVRKNSEDIQKNSEDIRKNTEDIRKNSEEIRKNSEDIRKNSEDINGNSEDIRKTNEEIRHIAMILERKPDQATLMSLDKRVTVLEQKLGVHSSS